MCEHHHAAKHILCSQCDMLVALPHLEHGQKAACPRCGTTLTVAWDAPRQRPTAYALAALFMLLLSNLFPFVNMNVAGGLRQPRHFFLVVCATGSCILPDYHTASGESRRITGTSERATGTGALSTQNLGNGRDFPRGCAGQFRQTDGLRQYWCGQQFSPLVFILCAATARLPVR